MKITRLLRTSTFRLAVIYLGLFSVSVVALLGYIHWNTAGALARHTDRAIADDISVMTAAYYRGGPLLLVRDVNRRVRHVDGGLYLAAMPGGAVVGNLQRHPGVRPDDDGWLEFSYHRPTANGDSDGDGDTPHAARALQAALPGGGFLLAGRDVQEQRGIETLITHALSWALALTLALGLAGGLLLSRNMLARVDAINRTGLGIMQGDLARRLPVSGVGDELDRLAENLNAMLDRIETLMAAMRQVTDNVAHDLRSPLNRMRSRLEVALMGRQSPDEYRAVLEKTITEADALLRLFNALLSIARLESGAARDHADSVNLAGVLRDAAELYEPVAEENNMRLIVEVSGEPSVPGNRDLLVQAVTNLIDNAIRHGRPASAAAGEIHLRVGKHPGSEAGEAVVLSVSDSGPGIPAADRGRVLDRFVRLEGSRNTPGSGLGLSLVRAIAREHGGSVHLDEAHPGAAPPGLCVSIRLTAGESRESAKRTG